jgi:signal transduction histidine kinase
MRTGFLRRFSVMSAGLWVAAALLLGAGVTYIIEQRMVERTTVATLDYYRNLTRYLVTDRDFVRPRSGREYAEFDALIRRNFFSSQVFSVKVFDRESRLIYHSLDQGLVGQRFADNPELQQALAGQVVLELSDLKKPEQVSERRATVGRLMEVYIPILAKGSDEIIGAYEIYSSVDPLYQDIQQLRVYVWASILFGLLTLYLALSWTFRRASHTILDQNRALARQADELRQAYEELKSAQSRLVQNEKLASAGRLAAGVVHEIGNPMASVLGLVDLLLRCRGGSQDRLECRENLGRIASEITRLRGILQGLLDYARPAGRVLRPSNLNGIVERTLLLVATQPTFRGIKVIPHLQDPSPVVRTDDRLLQQILVNVLMNAAQAMPEGGELTITTAKGLAPEDETGVTVGRCFSSGEDTAAITVTDSGPGIPEGDLPRIFEPFFSTKETGKGVGLGLAICHSIVEELGGAIAVRSAVGLGTTVRILLPANGAHVMEASQHAV